MTKVIRRPAKSKAEVDWEEFPNIVRQFLALKKQLKFLEERLDGEKGLKKAIKAVVDDYGEPDEHGHLLLELDHEIDGYGVLKHERRVSKSLDEDRATKLLKKKRIYDRCTTTVVILDEDEIAKAAFEGKLSGKEFDSMFDESITWALIPLKAK